MNENNQLPTEPPKDTLVSLHVGNTIEPLYYPIFFVAVLNLVVLFVAQPLEFWGDYSLNTVGFPFNYIVELNPFIYIAIYLLYLLVLPILFSILPKVFARILAVSAFMYHVWAVSSWTWSLLDRYGAPTDFYVVSYTNLSMLILIGGISFLMVNFASKLQPFKFVEFTKKSLFYILFLVLISSFSIMLINSQTKRVTEEQIANLETQSLKTNQFIEEKFNLKHDGMATISNVGNKSFRGTPHFYNPYFGKLHLMWTGKVEGVRNRDFIYSFTKTNFQPVDYKIVRIEGEKAEVVIEDTIQLFAKYCSERCEFKDYQGFVFKLFLELDRSVLEPGTYQIEIYIDDERIKPSEIVSEIFIVESVSDNPILTILKPLPDMSGYFKSTTTVNWTSEGIPEGLDIDVYLVSEFCENVECYKYSSYRENYISAANQELGVKWHDLVYLGKFKNNESANIEYWKNRHFLLPSGKYKFAIAFNHTPSGSEKGIPLFSSDYFTVEKSDYFDIERPQGSEVTNKLFNVIEGETINDFMSVDKVQENGYYGYYVIFKGALPVEGTFSVRETSLHESPIYTNYITINDEFQNLVPSIFSHKPLEFCINDSNEEILGQLKESEGQVKIIITEFKYILRTEKMSFCNPSAIVGSMVQ